MIDVDHAIDAVERRVGTQPSAASEARTVTITRTYDADVDELWDACTNAERIPRWFLPVSGDLRVGGHYQLEGNAGGTIETCDPPTSFTATWEYGDEATRIEVRLTPLDDGRTRFRLDHAGHVDDERWAEFGPGAVGLGWELALSGLALHLASGSPVNPGAFEAWSGSADGRRFMAESSRRWCDASIAAGTAPAAAEAAAARALAAYTGEGA